MKNGWARSLGIALLFIVVAWVFTAALAFIVAAPTTFVIILRTIISIGVVYAAFYAAKAINKRTNFFIISIVLVLVILYFLPINSNFSEEALDLNEELSAQNEDKYEYAKALFEVVQQKYTSPGQAYFMYPQRVFIIKDATGIWEMDGYFPSNVQAQLYQKLLLESGRFSKDELILVNAFCAVTPHGYIQMVHPDREIYADLWAVDWFEEYEFGQATQRPCNQLIGEPYP